MSEKEDSKEWKIATDVIDEIVDDLRDWRVLGPAWEDVPEEVSAEIKSRWAHIVWLVL
jgi:hypothetical protein